MLHRSMFVATALLLSGTSFASESASQNTASVSADSVQEAGDTLIHSVRLRIPYGVSTWSQTLDRSWSSNPIKLRYVDEPSCRSPYLNLYLRATGTNTWQQTSLRDGVDVHSLASFDAIRFDMQSPYLVDQVCTFNLYAMSVSDDGDGAWGQGILSGGADYAGGFAQDMEVNISAATMIKGFRIEIPEFCQGAQVLEAGTVTEGIYDIATVKDAAKNIFEVANGSVRAAKIRFSINGPYEARCFVPVYTYGTN